LISEITSQSEKFGRDHDNDSGNYFLHPTSEIHLHTTQFNGGGIAYHAQGGLSEFFQSFEFGLALIMRARFSRKNRSASMAMTAAYSTGFRRPSFQQVQTVMPQGEASSFRLAFENAIDLVPFL